MSTNFDNEVGADEDALSPADESALSAVTSAFGDLRLDWSLEQISARSNGIRRRRRAVPMVGAGVAALAAVGLGVAALSPAGHGIGTSTAVARPRMIADLAAFSVSDNTDGSITVQIKQLGDGPELQQILDKTGIHAMVIETGDQPYSFGESADPCGLIAQMTAAERGQLAAVYFPGHQLNGPPVARLLPRAMPPGATMVFVIVSLVSTSGDTSGDVDFTMAGLFDGKVPTLGCPTDRTPGPGAAIP